MSEKTKQLLENLRAIAQKPESTPVPLPATRTRDHYISNLGGDRIYSTTSGQLSLINKNDTLYHGKINKRSIIVKGLDGNNFRSYVYETADGRWFDRGGLPIKKPNNLAGGSEDDTSEEGSATEIVEQRTTNDADSE